MKKTLILLLAFVLVCSVFPVSADSYDDILEEAVGYLDDGDYEKAFACYQLAQKLQPDSEEAYMGEAKLHMLLAEYEEALTLLEIVLEKNPLSAGAWLEKCRVDILQGNAEAFEEDSVFAEVCGVDFSEDYLSIAEMYFHFARYQDAVDYFSLVEINGLDDAQRELYRKSLIAVGQREQAEALGLYLKSVRNEKLDAAFESDALTLVQTELPAISAQDFEFTDEFWETMGAEKPDDPYAELEEEFSEMEFTLLSCSPAGNSQILLADGMAISCYDGKYHILYPSQSRGVADEYGNLATYFGVQLQRLLGEEGVVYSHDGRYAAIYNIQISVSSGRFFIDPILIDLLTGEVFLTATYADRPQDGSGVVTTACFSSDDRYFYYVLYGTTAEHLCSLYRYDLQTDTTELCLSEYDLTYDPTLSETRNGELLILRNTRSYSAETAGIVSMNYADGRWMTEEYDFTLPTKYWFPNRLMYSDNSCYAMVLGKNTLSGGGWFSFQCFQPENLFEGLNRYWAISKDEDQVVEIEPGEFQSFLESLNPYSETYAATDFPYQQILCARLSPDGNYALLYTLNDKTQEDSSSSRHLFLVRLEDMEMKEIGGLDAQCILSGSMAAEYMPVIEWNTDTLIIVTEDGILTYQFQL